MQGKDGHAAGTQYQHGVARLNAPIHHQCTPGGQTCRGQRGSFFMGVAIGRQGECIRGHVDQFAGKAVHAVARDGLEGGGHGPARLPVGEEARHHAIPYGELCHALAHGADHAGAIGHGDATILCTDMAGDYAEVVVVERAGMNTHLDLACSGRARGGPVDQA
ncbi:hypothetical protein D3C84_393930 [compost metagenome]